MSKVDLHIHSSVSGGTLSPEEIVQKSAELGLTVIALADHDATEGVAPAQAAAKSYPQLRIIPAIELDTYNPDGQLHILGYFIDCDNAILQATLEKLRESRRGKTPEMLAKLADLGIHIDSQRVQEIAGTAPVGLKHLIEAMMEKGYVSSFMEGFTKYLGPGSSAYVGGGYKMNAVEAVALILKAKGLPVLAHPFGLPLPGHRFAAKDLEGVVAELKAAGMVGIEAYRNHHSDDQIAKLVSLAQKHDLILTGGTDYRGWDPKIESMIGSAPVPMEAVEQLIALAEERGLMSAT